MGLARSRFRLTLTARLGVSLTAAALVVLALALAADSASATPGMHVYDGSSTATTPAASTWSGAFRSYDVPGHLRRTRMRSNSLRLAAKAGGETATTAVRIHGNSASSPATSYLYRLTNSRTGEYLKTGISKNPFSRYTSKFMQDKEMEILTSGSRREMLNLERFIVERDPGLLNREPWAGRYANDLPGVP